MRRTLIVAAAGTVLLAATACGGGTGATGQAPTGSGAATSGVNPNGPEANLEGDIPDTTVYVPYTDAAGHFTVSVPQGWARTQQGSAVMFTDKLNSVLLDAHPAAAAPTVASARADEVPRIQSDGRKVKIGSARVAQRKMGDAVEIAYSIDSPPDPMTGKSVREAVERYEFFHNGTEAIVTVSGPVGADNVHPWRTVTDSVAWSP